MTSQPTFQGHYDAVVIGGGPVGDAAALAVHAAGFSVLLLESRRSDVDSGAPRPLAVSHGSSLILDRLGVWSNLADAAAIKRIHISHRGRFGRTVFSSSEAALPALGYVTDSRELLRALEKRLGDSTVQVLYGTRVSSLAHDARTARIEFESANGIGECFASVVLVADGSAASAAVDVRIVDYGQHAVSAWVEADRSHDNTAYERFTDEGPLALLPYGRGYALVWTTSEARSRELCATSETSFLEELQERFGERAGRFVSVSDRSNHAIALRIAEQTTSGRAVLIGNAAQALHPVAGQGFNLGLRDAWELAAEMRARGVENAELLSAYRKRREIDRTASIGFTHSLVKIFSNDVWPVAAARGLGLALLDCIPPAKDFIVRRMVFGSRG